VFGAVLIRLLETGQFGYILLGVASALYALTMIAFCRAQARSIDDGFRMRFENQALVEALKLQTVEAEEARRKAELASLAKSQFLAAASHDLRQPLYALSLFTASLGTLKLDAEGRRVVGNIQDSVAVMESLFTGLLDISKLEAGVVQPRLSSVSVDALFDRLSQYFLPLALERGLDLRFRSEGEWLTSDEALLEQVLSNLVSNALRSTSAGGVLVAARRRPGAVRLEVWDTGIGIGEADRQRIFDEFVQLGKPGARPPQGPRPRAIYRPSLGRADWKRCDAGVEARPWLAFHDRSARRAGAVLDAGERGSWDRTRRRHPSAGRRSSGADRRR
jgi:two-component system, sensor histidine kinase